MQGPSDEELSAIASKAGERLREARLTLVTAESCTGGWIAKVVTDIAGSSDWFDCGMATYSYEAKQAMLGVRPETLEYHGAVSRETVLEMVAGAQSEEHTSELQSLMRISYAVFCLKKKKTKEVSKNDKAE